MAMKMDCSASLTTLTVSWPVSGWVSELNQTEIYMITINKIKSRVQILLARLNQIAEAIDYDPHEQVLKRISLLEKELAKRSS